MTAAAIYARISLDDKSVPKVENQIRACEELALDNSFEVLRVFKDDGIPASGKGIKDRTRDKRPGFDALLKAVAAGEFDVILAVEAERLARTYPDGLDVIDACEQGDTFLYFDTDGHVDPRTPAGEVQAMAMFVGGRKEGRVKSARQGRRYDAETSDGMPLWGQRTFGFRGVQEVGRNGRVSLRWTQHDPAEAQAIRDAAAAFLEPGATMYAVVKMMNDGPHRTTRAGQVRKRPGSSEEVTLTGEWTVASLKALLINPRVAGLVVRQGVVQAGVTAAWEPIISPETRQAILDKLAVKVGTAPGRKPHSLGSGVVYCECGSIMRSTTFNGGVHGLRCEAGRDGRSNGRKHATIMDSYVDGQLRDAVASAFVVGPSNLIPSDKFDMRAIEGELAKLRAARGRLVRLIADPDSGVDEGEVSGELRDIKRQEDALQTQRSELVTRSAQAAMLVDLRSEVFKDGRASIEKGGQAHAALAARFEELPLAQRRELVRTLLRVEVAPGRGPDRVRVNHKVVTTLNDDGDPTDEEIVALGGRVSAIRGS